MGPAIAAYDPKYLDECRGIARGAGVDFLDVLAINLRTEIIHSARVRQGTASMSAECTAFGITAEMSARGTVLIAQNWDYLPHATRTSVVLDCSGEPDDVSFITIVEAGLLAKMGMNSAGVALVINGLATRYDRAEPGVPFHVLLRRMLESRTVADAVAVLKGVPRASSGNYMLASRDESIVDVEAWAGVGTHVATLAPDNGLLVHTNHCLSVPTCLSEVPFHLADNSRPRRDRVLKLLHEIGTPVGVEDLQRVLSDHAQHPWGVCTHEDLRVSEHERYPTGASLIMEPATRRMFLADGNPCTAPWRELDTSTLGTRSVATACSGATASEDDSGSVIL
jgi:isopenicillin-N N-acyltransferase-like protein